ncbi:hypothetical protein Ciccas_000240 [Cichlidogyrus casuarinus]|uniref:Uncharacterized protein n=1 Tax=Cichlidogyrus casuarinus TaxID=1844966 RepID=A0ABD2QNI0_9PLAT
MANREIFEWQNKTGRERLTKFMDDRGKKNSSGNVPIIMEELRFSIELKTPGKGQFPGPDDPPWGIPRPSMRHLCSSSRGPASATSDT